MYKIGKIIVVSALALTLCGLKPRLEPMPVPRSGYGADVRPLPGNESGMEKQSRL